MLQQTPVPTCWPQDWLVTLVIRFVALVAHTSPPEQSAFDAQGGPGVQSEPPSPHAVPPAARVKQKSQLAGQTSSHVAHVPAALQAWMGSQQVPLQQTFGAAQSCPAWPFWLTH